MRIAIASKKEDKSGEVSLVGGRASYYLVFEDGKKVETIKNPFKRGGGGAGFSVAEMLSEKDVDLVISGNFGRNMISALDNKGIKYKQMSKLTVKEALDNAQA